MADDSKKEVEKVLLKKEDFNKKNIGKLVQRTEEIQLPELGPMLGLGFNQVAIVKVSQLTLDQFIKIQGESLSNVKNLMDGIIEASHSKEAVEMTVSEAIKKMDGRTIQVIDTIEEGLVEPKLGRITIIKLTNQFPMTAYKLYTRINVLTSEGADLKKNSS